MAAFEFNFPTTICVGHFSTAVLHSKFADKFVAQLAIEKTWPPLFHIRIFMPSFSLKECNDVWKLCDLLGVNFENLSKKVYPSNNRLYRCFFIPKKSGGLREIYCPIKSLKNLQKKIKIELEKEIKYRSPAHGFIKGKSIITNAEQHIGKTIVLNLDLEDFFKNIHFGRIKKLFESSPLNLKHSVSTFLAHICCRGGVLIAGSPTSPIISNMICYKLDGQLQSLAKKNHCTYTRYADDITFSFTCSERKLPRGIVHIDESSLLGFKLGDELSEIISSNNFTLNESKIRLSRKSQRQEVTGLIVNSKVNVKRDFIRRTSSMIHALKIHGAEDAEKEHYLKYKKTYIPERQNKRQKDKPGDLYTKVIKGRLNYLRMVRGEDCNLWRKLMYDFTVAMKNPDESYKRTWLDDAAESTVIFNTYDGCGSGFLINHDIKKYPNGLIITNYHVIPEINSDNISNIEVHTWMNPSKGFLLLKFVASSKDLDIAILTADIPFPVSKFLVVNSCPNYKPGIKIHTIGYPDYSSGEDPTFISTKIKGKTTYHGQLRYQIIDEIKHGNSGGPVFDSDRKVIGIVSNGNEKGAPKNNKSSFIPIETLLDFINCQK